MLLELALIFVVATEAVNAAGENAREFRSICVFYQLLTQAIPEHKAVSGTAANPTQEDPAAKVTEIVRRIIKLNLTTVQSEIAAILADNTPEGTHDKIKENAAKKGYFERLEKAEFETMKADFKAISTDETSKDFRTKYGLPLNQDQKSSLQKAFAHLTKRALDIRDEHKNIMDRLENVRKEARKQALTALYGAEFADSIGADNRPSQPWADFPDATKFPWADTAGRDTICAKLDGTQHKAGQALAQDAVCLCVGESATSNIYCQAPNLGTNNQIASGSSGGTTKALKNWQDYTGACKTLVPAGTTQLTTSALQEALTAFYASLGTNSATVGTAPASAERALAHGAAIFGYYAFDNTQPPGCKTPSTASAAQTGRGACIDYSTLLTTKAGIPWVNAVRAVAEQLIDADKIARESQMTIAKAQQLQNQMEALLLMGSLRKSADATATTVTVDEQNKCAKFNGNETECTKNDCDYEKTNKKCKHKSGTENTAAGTGAAKEGEKDKCSEAKTPEDCAKVTGTKPEGKAAVCGWIDYIDGKGKVEPACRSSSFLVSKKLGLIDAAFVALLF
uniref:Variant surface glycoprotein n=1 Tax=Trypanosoma brucei TaxID=5691 RepID=A0A1V0G093_9TRYP|nr:variant surface glycoprotein [Trypanosoma brucei]